VLQKTEKVLKLLVSLLKMTHKRNKGFTVIELLVAMSIMVIISAMCIKAVSGISKATEILEERFVSGSDVSVYLSTLVKDFEYVRANEFSYSGGRANTGVSFKNDILSISGVGQGFDYFIKDGVLYRGAIINEGFSEELVSSIDSYGYSSTTPLLNNVSEVSARVYSSKLGWTDMESIQMDLQSGVVSGVELTVTFVGSGSIRLVNRL